MIVLRIELHSAVTKRVTELGRIHIANDGSGTGSVGNYIVAALRGRSTEQLDRGARQREGRVTGFPRQQLHVWNLAARALKAMGYG